MKTGPTDSDVPFLRQALSEQISHRQQIVGDFVTLFNEYSKAALQLTPAIRDKLTRLAGTTLLEAMYIWKSAVSSRAIDGDWCEYGVAHGRTSALLAELLKTFDCHKKIWLYDSFEGLPEPHEKDILINDIMGKGNMADYKGWIAFPDLHVKAALTEVLGDQQRFVINKGWITPEMLSQASPPKISMAFLDMDFYQSTFDVLEFLVDRMSPGAVAIVDDYGFFSEGVRTAVSEIMQKYPGAFTLEHPFKAKFVLLTRA